VPGYLQGISKCSERWGASWGSRRTFQTQGQVAREEYCRVRVAVEREGDAQVFSCVSCWHSYYSLKLLRKQKGCL